MEKTLFETLKDKILYEVEENDGILEYVLDKNQKKMPGGKPPGIIIKSNFSDQFHQSYHQRNRLFD